MSADVPDPSTQHDTPEDHVVMAITIEIGLTPDWWEAILEVASRHVRRMMTVERPDQWIVKVELHKDKVAAFNEDLKAAWTAFSAGRDDG